MGGSRSGGDAGPATAGDVVYLAGDGAIHFVYEV